MLPQRVIVLQYSGGEMSTEAKNKIGYLLKNDDSASAQHLIMIEFNHLDIAKHMAAVAEEVCSQEQQMLAEEYPNVRINVRKHTSSILDEAITYISNNMDVTCKDARKIPTLDIVQLYQEDPRTRVAFKVVCNTNDDELFENETVVDKKVTKSFIKVLREIVKKIQ